jgi:hypothetical protein
MRGLQTACVLWSVRLSANETLLRISQATPLVRVECRQALTCPATIPRFSGGGTARVSTGAAGDEACEDGVVGDDGERQTARMRAEPSAARTQPCQRRQNRANLRFQSLVIRGMLLAHPAAQRLAQFLLQARDPRVDLGEVQLDKQPWGVKRVYLLPMIMIRTPIR